MSPMNSCEDGHNWIYLLKICLFINFERWFNQLGSTLVSGFPSQLIISYSKNSLDGSAGKLSFNGIKDE